MKKKKGIRVIAVMTLLIVLAGSSYYYSIHYNRHAMWIHPDDLEKLAPMIPVHHTADFLCRMGKR